MATNNKTQRLTDKSAFILNKILSLYEKKKGRNIHIENSLSKEWPQFSELYDQKFKKGKK